MDQTHERVTIYRVWITFPGCVPEFFTMPAPEMFRAAEMGFVTKSVVAMQVEPIEEVRDAG